MQEDDMSNLINNFKNILNNNNKSSQESTTDNDSNFQDSNLNITPDMISNLMANLNNSSNNSNDENSNAFSNNIDIDTILKVKNIIEKLNSKDDPRERLLYSLKPYLRESRKQKIDQYVNLLKITNITDLFKTGKGDTN